MSCPDKRIDLYHTDKEWAILEYEARKASNADFRSLLNREMARVGGIPIYDGGDDIDKPIKKGRNFIIPAHTSCQLMRVAYILNVPLATVVARFIVTPMLNDHYESNGIHFIR